MDIHSPEFKAILFVGAEGVSESQDIPGVREPTNEELEELRQWFIDVRWKGDAEEAARDFADFFIDHNGRPYFLRTVTAEAPVNVRIKADGHLRCVRLT